MTARTCLLVCLIPTALAASACEVGISAGGVEGTFDRSLTVTGPLELEVQTGSGTIQVRQGATGSVQVRGRVRAGFGNWISLDGTSAAERVRQIETDPPVEQSGNTIRLGRPRRANAWDGVAISYEITVPADTKLIARSGSGDLIIGDVTGPVEASTGSGDIRIGRTSQAVRATAGSGDIELNGARSVVARTGSGSVRALAVGDIEVHSGSGEVSVAQQEAGRVDVSTGSGDIDVRGARGPMHVRASSGDINVEGTPAAAWDVSASSGDVSVEVPATAAFDLDAHTGSGRIETAFPVTTTGTESKRELKGQVRGGGPRLEVSTSSGGIRIR